MEDRCSKEKKNIYKKNTTENQVGYENVVLFPCLSNVALSWWLNVASTAGVAFLAYYTSQCSLPLCIYISPSLHLPHKANVAQTLPLFGCGFKAKCWRICSDRTRFRAQWRREGGSDGNVGEKRMVWRRRQMNQREETRAVASTSLHLLLTQLIGSWTVL